MNQKCRETIEKLIFNLEQVKVECLTEEAGLDLDTTLNNIEEAIDCLRRVIEPRRKQP